MRNVPCVRVSLAHILHFNFVSGGKFYLIWYFIVVIISLWCTHEMCVMCITWFNDFVCCNFNEVHRKSNVLNKILLLMEGPRAGAIPETRTSPHVHLHANLQWRRGAGEQQCVSSYQVIRDAMLSPMGSPSYINSLQITEMTRFYSLRIWSLLFLFWVKQPKFPFFSAFWCLKSFP